jgi:hypothetical protein
VSFSSVSFSTVFLLSVNLLPAPNSMFYLYYFLKLEICSHLAWRRKSARRVRRTPVGPPKYELLTTAVRKLLASVAFRSDLVVTRKTLQRPTYPPNTNHLRPPVGNKWLDGLRSRISARPECDLLGQDPLPAHRISTPTISRSQVFNHVRISVSFCPTRCLLKRRFPTPPTRQIWTWYMWYPSKVINL